MTFVDKLIFPPFECAISGKTVEGSRPGLRFFDTQRTLMSHQPRVYVSEAGMEILAREFGYRSEEEYRALEDAYTELQAEIERERMYVEQAKQLKNAIDTLESEGFRARRKPGPKPKEMAA
jgi:hypothetical protein